MMNCSNYRDVDITAEYHILETARVGQRIRTPSGLFFCSGGKRIISFNVGEDGLWSTH